LTYLGLDVEGAPVVAGRPFTLVHHWRVDEAPGAGWHVVVHLEAPGTRAAHLTASHDPPVGAWRTGAIVREAHRVALPASWRADAVEVYVLVEKVDAEGIRVGPRMKVKAGAHDDEGRVLAATIPVQH
jgi:hypothetical protein